MKPAGYQSMASTVMSQPPRLTLDPVLSTSKLMYCEKCGFASTDTAAFKKHVFEHMGTRFYCFYCNSVFFSEAELNAHLKQHTAKYPFKCPHCGQGYMRRLCLVKHIDRLHSKTISQGPAKPAITKTPHVTVSSASPSVPSTDPSSLRPTVRVTVPTPSTAAARLGKDEQKIKTLDTQFSNATNGDGILFSPVNGHIQPNRALTLALPEDVAIPAGCLVELVEVKTVNGTKELKLRVVSQQENESVIKDTRTTVSENTAVGKPFSSSLNYPNTMKSTSMGMCTVNRKSYETKTVNVQHPDVVSVSMPAKVSISKNLQNQERAEKSKIKRTSQEIINLESNTIIPNKVSKSILNTVREGNSSVRVLQREPMNHSTPPSTVMSSRVINRLMNTMHPENMGARVCQRTVDERKNSLQEHPSSGAPRMTGDIKSGSQDVSVKLGVRKMRPSDNAATKIKQEVAGLKQQSLIPSSMSSVNLLLAAPAQMRPPAVLECRDNFTPTVPFPATSTASKTLNEVPAVKQLLVTHTNAKTPAWPHNVRSNNRAAEGGSAEPESFPVISSVFSLSQQPEDAQGPIQPLVMALRGIVMDKTNSSNGVVSDNIKILKTVEVKGSPTSAYRAQVDTKDDIVSNGQLLTKQTFHSVKIEEEDKRIQQVVTINNVKVKEEKNSTAPTDIKTCSQTPEAKVCSTDQGSVSYAASHTDTPETTNPLQQTPDSVRGESSASSKFLTVSLKRVQVGVWKKSKKRLKTRISKCGTRISVASLSDCTIIYPMPLKVDQLVKRPGPNQPVVVLNHPKPRASLEGVQTNTLTDTGAAEVAPKCQILKMRLSKVMGQKYEVMGCTVRDCS
ncbi:uncharacterized protein znf518b [Sphaeramia orbicularis]|uniref:Uncharacterized LOC115427569 n=1 Tax=Sphaeramia orbicularis TaxID=375764 RepID=A0A672ZUD8_9TELE|nr:uncharacterized protein LOC115427569 [Sphaeramia orbicularis]